MRKYFLISLVSILMFSFVFSNNVSLSYASNDTNLEKIIEEELLEITNDLELDIDDINVQVDSTDLLVNIDSSEYQGTISIQSNVFDLDSSIQNVVYSETHEDGTDEYSVFFGTLEEKELMDAALAADEEILLALEKNVVPEESITVEDHELFDSEEVTAEPEEGLVESDVILHTEALMEQSANVITTPEELSNSPMVFTNIETLESQEVLLSHGVAAATTTIGVGLLISSNLLAHLIAIGMALIVAGIAVFTLAYVAKTNSVRDKRYNHFSVTTGTSGQLKGKLAVYGGINFNRAVARVAANADVWSITQNLALRVAKAASPIGKSTGVELHGKTGSGYFKHYHGAIGKVNGKYKYRLSSHSYFGRPV